MLGEETRKIKCGTKVGGGQDRLGRLDTNRGALGTRAPPAELERRARWPSLSPTYHVHTTRLSHRATQLSPTTHVREEKDKRREAKRQRSATLMSGLPMKLDDEMFRFLPNENEQKFQKETKYITFRRVLHVPLRINSYFSLPLLFLDTAARMPLSNGTTVATWPNDSVLIGWAKDRLGSEVITGDITRLAL